MVAFSQSLADPEWDMFLQTTALGQYQQSSMWARYKAADGWQPLRYLFTINDRIIGGFQVLCKKTLFGRVGYVPKGPVLPEAGPAMYEHAIDRMVRAAHDHNLRALIAQPPDECVIDSELWKGKKFIGSNLLGVIDSTLLISHDSDFNDVIKRMNRETRRRIRQARETCLSVREGEKEELPVFFELMAATCRRQVSTPPNPLNLTLLKVLWEAFQPGKSIRLTFAVHNGEILAGLLCINFGNRVTLWKKGWSESGKEFRPNELLYADAFSWAYQNKFACCDFASLNRDIALSLLTGNPLSASQKKSRDMFNLRFGGAPKLLPQAMIYIKSNVLRRAFQLFNNKIQTIPNIFR
jgi:lipid II:glycine glycyltransferase (peptidoglycan interpeptide bridge formation enzyme)